VLPKAELVLVYGASGSGKSFFALDLAMAMSCAVLWRGHAVNKGRVAYVVAEGSGSFRNRIHAYAIEHKLNPADIDLILLPAAPNLMQLEIAKTLAYSIKERGQFAVVIIDTFAQVTPGANENSGDDMGTALMHCKGIHRVTGATVVLIHHAGKDASKGARGWSGTHAAADCVIEVVRDGDHRAATVVKQKDGMDGAEYGFALDIVVVGHDDDGEAITSCVLRSTDQGRPQTKKRESLTERQQWIVEAIEEDLTGEGLTQKEVCERVVPRMVDKRTPEQVEDKVQDRRGEQVVRSLDSLINRNRVVCERGRFKTT